jgi:hypothetical protein
MPIKQKKYYQLIPQKILRKLAVIEALIEPLIDNYSTDNLKEVISIVACHTRKDNDEIPLKMYYFRMLVASGDLYMKHLCEQGIILRSGYYVPGQLSFKYSFAPKYKSKFIALPLTNAKLILRIEQAYERFRRDAAKTARGHLDQTKYLNSAHLSIDPGYIDFLNANLTAGTEQYNLILANAMRIVNGDITYSIDDTSGRFHSNITNLVKGLRPYLRVDGQPLCNIDVKNSQPYLSTIILTNPGKVSYMTKNAAFALLLETLKVTLTEDVKKYISLVVSGQLYEYLMQEFAAEGLSLNRSETKVQVLRILFARNRAPKNETNRKAREVFKTRFPKVHKIFSKVRGSQRGDKFTSFKRFAILLQRIEAYLMLDRVIKHIYKELPGTIAITIHDSVMTGILTNNVAAVRKILIDELTFFVGFPPQIAMEGLEKEKEGKELTDTFYNQYDAENLVTVNNSLN